MLICEQSKPKAVCIFDTIQKKAGVQCKAEGEGELGRVFDKSVNPSSVEAIPTTDGLM